MPELPPHIDRIVLIGVMGSGKTTVGQKVAARLNWRVIDLDREIEAHTGMSVAQIFERQGESTFRRLEQRLTGQLLSEHNLVFTPGGGWVTHLAAAQIPANTAIFWLRVSPEVAVQRVADTQARPLLAGDPLQRARELADQRKETYATMGAPIETDGRTPDEVAADIVEAVQPRVKG